MNWSARLFPSLKSSVFSPKGSGSTRHTVHTPQPTQGPQTHRYEVNPRLQPSRTLKIPCQLQVLIAGGHRGKGMSVAQETPQAVPHQHWAVQLPSPCTLWSRGNLFWGSAQTQHCSCSLCASEQSLAKLFSALAQLCPRTRPGKPW